MFADQPPTRRCSAGSAWPACYDRGLRLRRFRREPPGARGAAHGRALGEVAGTFDVGGRKLNLRCYGTGSPRVVFESAHGADWVCTRTSRARWAPRPGRPCRTGRTWASATRGPERPTGSTSQGPDRPVGRGEVPPPYVFAGHVDGGPLALLHAAEHPGSARRDARRRVPGRRRALGALIPARERRRYEAPGQRRSRWISIAWPRRRGRGCMTCRRSRRPWSARPASTICRRTGRARRSSARGCATRTATRRRSPGRGTSRVTPIKSMWT